MPPQALPINGQAYVAMAAGGDQFEIQSSQIALIKAFSPDVRNFAQMLINDHTTMSSKLIAAATASGLAAPIPTLTADQQQMLNALQAAPAGLSFDQMFLRDQIIAHQMALALHSNYAANGDILALRAVASSAVPIIQMHLNTASQLMIANGGMMASDFCPANYWCNSDVDAMGASFSVCCPSDVPLLPPVSVAATIYTPALPTTYTAPATTTIYASAVPAANNAVTGYVRAFGTVVPVVRVPSNTAGGLYGNVPVGTPAAPLYTTTTPLY
jgi:putative membrane protein